MAVVVGIGYRAVGKTKYDDVSTVLPLGPDGRARWGGCDNYDDAVKQGTHMLDNGTWTEFMVERFYYRKGTGWATSPSSPTASASR